MTNNIRTSPFIKPLLTTTIILSSIIFIVTLLTTYGAFLTTRVAPGLPFQITHVGQNNTPTLLINQQNPIEWDTRPENITLYPAEAISLCPPNTVELTPDCEILDFHTANDGSTSVYVPPTLSPGTYNLLFTAWNTSNRLVFALNNTVQISLLEYIEPTEQPQPTEESEIPEVPQEIIESPEPTDEINPSPSPSIIPTSNTSLQLLILNNQPVTEPVVQFSLSNIDPDSINCVSVNVNGQPAPFTGNLPLCE